jgi:hypothetical protein
MMRFLHVTNIRIDSLREVSELAQTGFILLPIMNIDFVIVIKCYCSYDSGYNTHFIFPLCPDCLHQQETFFRMEFLLSQQILVNYQEH